MWRFTNHFHGRNPFLFPKASSVLLHLGIDGFSHILALALVAQILVDVLDEFIVFWVNLDLGLNQHINPPIFLLIFMVPQLWPYCQDIKWVYYGGI